MKNIGGHIIKSGRITQADEWAGVARGCNGTAGACFGIRNCA